MDNDFKRMLEKLEQFRRTHIKVQLPDRHALIKQNYERFVMEHDHEANTLIVEDKNEINITITTTSIMSCDVAGYSFNCLVGLANTTSIEIQDGAIVINLWYRLWEWVTR